LSVILGQETEFLFAVADFVGVAETKARIGEMVIVV
jgi:hypothetical protein